MDKVTREIKPDGTMIETTETDPFRLELKESAAGKPFIGSLKVRGTSIEELRSNMEEVLKVAQEAVTAEEAFRDQGD